MIRQSPSGAGLGCAEDHHLDKLTTHLKFTKS